MTATNNGSLPSTVHIETNIDLINEVLRNASPAETPYYQGILHDLYLELTEAQQREKPIAGPSGAYNHNSSSNAQMPSSPLNRLPASRKRTLGPIDLPEAKRVSNQPSPVTPTSDFLDAPPSARSQQWTLPSRPSVSTQIVDLTESIPSSPEPVHNHSTLDPFPELIDAYQPDGGRPVPASAFNKDFMNNAELADFLIASPPPDGDYARQVQLQHAVLTKAPAIANREVPYFRDSTRPPWVEDTSDSEDYGHLSLTVQEADAIEELFENIKDHGEAPEDREPTPKIMSCTLKEYQKIGLTWLLKMEKGKVHGGILADEMGLGKTVQALSLICANPPDDPRCKTTLIVAPVALMRQWEKEIERHILPRHKLKVYLYHGSGKKVDFSKLRTYDIVLTTFGSLTSEFKYKGTPRDEALVQQELRNPNFRRKGIDALGLLGRECMWYRIIIDEAHNIKNRNAICSKAAADLQARYRLCMTGTPMMNSVDELYPLLRFLRLPQYIDWTKYSMDIARLVKDKRAHMRKKGMDRVQILLKSVMLRRQKTSLVDGKEICTIPPKHTQQDNVKFSDAEQQLYKALESKSKTQFNKYQQAGTVTANYAAILVLLLRLRQCCCHPHLITDLSQPATSGIAEDDLLDRAQHLNEDVINRLLAFDSFECPVCLEADPNPTIILPCGHTVCGECVQKLIDPARLQDNNEEATTSKCPQCRGKLEAKLITDYKHFCKVHCPERLELSDDGNDTETDDESDSEDEDDEKVDKKGNLAGFVVDDEDDEDYKPSVATSSDIDSADEIEPKIKKRKGKGKARANPKKTLAQLKKDSLRNKAAKQRYLRRLEKTFISSAKIDKTVQLLEDIRENDPTEKTLIFSQFTSLLDLVEVPLYQRRIRYQRYDGSMKMDERADAVNAFMDNPDQNVMLVSLKAGNAGLNLWKASQVIILDPFWNPFIEDQAVDRAHRMPQPRKVFVHRVLVPETVEDRICKIQDNKREIVNTALDEQTSKGLSRLGVSELRYLFGLGS